MHTEDVPRFIRISAKSTISADVIHGFPGPIS